MRSEGEELDPKQRGQLTIAVVMEGHHLCQKCKVQRELGMEMRSLNLSLLHSDLLPVPPTGNQPPARTGCSQSTELEREGQEWMEKEEGRMIKLHSSVRF